MAEENYENLDTLDLIEIIGRELMLKIDRTKPTGPRNYYQCSQILLKVEEMRDKKGRTGEQEVAERLSKYAKAMAMPVPQARELRKLIQQATKKEKQIQKWASVQPGDIKELVEIIGKILAILISALAVYDRVRKTKRKAKTTKSKASNRK